MDTVINYQTKELYRHKYKAMVEMLLILRKKEHNSGRWDDLVVHTFCPIMKGRCRTACINFNRSELKIGSHYVNGYGYGRVPDYYYIYEVLNHCTNPMVTGTIGGDINIYNNQ